MKLDVRTDFTKLARATSIARTGESRTAAPDGAAMLAHDERHLRRRVIELADGDKVLVDLPEPVALNDRDRLLLEDGRQIEIIATEEELYEIRGRDAVHLAELAWHIGNRHLAAQIERTRILILRDHVIRAMLEGLAARVTHAYEVFRPLRGAYSGGHSHGHGGPLDHGHHGHHHDD